MKKLMTLMLGLAFLTTTVVVAQSTDTTKTGKSKKSKKSTKSSTETKQ